MKSSHLDLLNKAATVLATYGWEKTKKKDHEDSAVQNLLHHFETPLEHAGVDIPVLVDEWHALCGYGKNYLNLVEDSYQTIWWKILNNGFADNGKWTNILALVRLLFTLPVANGSVERIFSRLNLIKSDRHCSLGEDSLENLVRICVAGPPRSQWDASSAIRCWWKDKLRRHSRKTEMCEVNGSTLAKPGSEN